MKKILIALAIIIVIIVVAGFMMRPKQNAPVEYAYITKNEALCADAPTMIIASGVIAEPGFLSSTVAWNALSNPKPAARCGTTPQVWSRGTDAVWNAQWVGSKGVAPTINKDLPVVVSNFNLTYK